MTCDDVIKSYALLHGHHLRVTPFYAVNDDLSFHTTGASKTVAIVGGGVSCEWVSAIVGTMRFEPPGASTTKNEICLFCRKGGEKNQ